MDKLYEICEQKYLNCDINASIFEIFFFFGYFGKNILSNNCNDNGNIKSFFVMTLSALNDRAASKI